MGGAGVPFPQPARAAMRTGAQEATEHRVLIVDDDDAIRELLSDLLKDAGYVVAQAKNGREGVERARAFSPQVILLDKLMPDGDGTLFATEYAKTEAPRAPIVALCAAPDAAEWSAAIGAAAYVPKPFDIELLLDLVAAQARSGGVPSRS